MATLRLNIGVDEREAAIFQKMANARREDVAALLADRLSRQVDQLSAEDAAEYELSAEDWVAIEDGLDQADWGEVVSHEDFHAEVRTLLVRNEG